MKLKPHKAGRRGGGGRRGARPMGARPRGRMASKPGVPLRRRIGRRLPSLHRALAALAAAAGVAVLVALLGGPWLRVGAVDWSGVRFTPDADVESALSTERGRSVLAVDTRALRDRLEALPAVLDARVTASLTGAVQASLVEREVAFVWETSRVRLLADADGLLFAAVPLDAPLDDELGALPRVADAREEARLLTVGDRVPGGLLRTAAELAGLDPAALGSSARRLAIALDDDYGFSVRAEKPAWEAALGVYGLDPRETAASASARLERQVTAIRTLFASRDEDEIRWVDARNPGKVYFRAKG